MRIQKESLKEYTVQKLREAEAAERAGRITALEKEIQSVDLNLDDYKEISLLNVEVTQKGFGVGVVTEQAGNRIKVSFGNAEKSYVLHKKYPMHPTFEDDKEIIETFTQYADLLEKKKKLTDALAALK